MENWGFNHWSRVDNKRAGERHHPYPGRQYWRSEPFPPPWSTGRRQVGVGVGQKERPPGPSNTGHSLRIYRCHQASTIFQAVTKFNGFWGFHCFCSSFGAYIGKFHHGLEMSWVFLLQPSVFMKLSREFSFSEVLLAVGCRGPLHRVLPDLCRTLPLDLAGACKYQWFSICYYWMDSTDSTFCFL